MSDELENTPEETDEDFRNRHREDQMASLVTVMAQESEDRATDKVTALVHSLLKGKKSNTDLVTEPIEQAPARVPARSAGRTLPASLTDSRYRFLPAWQRAFRNPDEDYQVARFMRALACNDQVTLRTIAAEDRLVRADLEEGTSTAGAPFSGTAGQLLPLPISNYLLEAMYKGARMRQHARVFQRSVGASLRIPMQDAVSVSTWTDESAAASGTEPTASGAINLVLQKLTNLVGVSNEVLEDEVFGLASWLINDVGMEMAQTEDGALYSSGTGTNDQPRGFEAGDSTGTSAPVYFVKTLTQAADNEAATLIDYLHLIKMYYALPEKERAGAIWTGNSVLAQILSSMLDLNGRPILAMANDPGMIVGDAEAGAQTRMVFGRPFIEMPGKTGAVDETVNRLYFVNMSRSYAILEAGGIRVAATTEGGTAFATDQTHFRFIRRVDGAPFNNPIPTSPQYVYTGNITGAGTPIA
jgi:HK97 family phage major capsid protein